MSTHSTRTHRTWLLLPIALLTLSSVLGATLVLGQGGTGRGNTNSKKPAPKKTTTTKRAPINRSPKPAKSIAEIDQKLAELKKKREALVAQYTAEWPEVKQLDAQIDSLEKQRAALLGKTAKSGSPSTNSASANNPPSNTSTAKPKAGTIVRNPVLPAPATLDADPVLFPPDTRNLHPKPKSTDEPADTRVFSVKEVDQKARVLEKPVPLYTEEARKNLVSGTVVLKAVLSSSGQVTNIQVIRSLPNGLTERAIEAAKKLKFVPAVKDGHPVSQHIELQYNFNPY